MDTLAVRLTLPTTKRVVDFHHQAIAHAGRTTKRELRHGPKLSLHEISEVVVFLEVHRVRDAGDLAALGAFVLQEVGDQLFGEYSAGGEVIVVLFQ